MAIVNLISVECEFHDKSLYSGFEFKSLFFIDREQLLSRLQAKDEEFDVLVIGGGATGCGVALDAQTRGIPMLLKVLVDTIYLFNSLHSLLPALYLTIPP